MRIALYARVSTEEQTIRGLSIDAQLSALRQFAGDQAVGEYVDSGVSARIQIKKRPELQRLLRDVEAGKIDLVAFTKLDRWTRNVREYYKAQDVLDAHSVAWRAIHEDYETQTATGRLKVNIMLAISQDEADRTSERVKAVFEEKKRQGLVINGNMPVGIRYENGLIFPNEDAERVRELFQRYIAIRSTNQISRESAQILGRPYSVRGCKQMMQNKKYLDAGVVTPETWAAVQTILKERETRMIRTDRVYLFSGLLICPECGYKLTVRAHKCHNTVYVYYRCDHAVRNGYCGWRGSIREDRLEDYLCRHILAAVNGFNVRTARQQKKSKVVDVAALRRKLDRITDLYVEERIDKGEYERRAEPIRDAIKTATVTPQTVNVDEIRSAMETYTSMSKAARKAFWSALVRQITPDGDSYNIALILP